MLNAALLVAQDNPMPAINQLGVSMNAYEGNPFSIEYTYIKETNHFLGQEKTHKSKKSFFTPKYLGLHARITAFYYGDDILPYQYTFFPNQPNLTFSEQTSGINIKTGINLITVVKRKQLWQWTQLLSFTLARHQLEKNETDITGTTAYEYVKYLLHPGFESELSYHFCVIGSLYAGLSLCGGIKQNKLSLFNDELPGYAVLRGYAPAQGFSNSWFYMMPGLHLKFSL